MAETYTSNLGLTKPDYDSPADISVINSNMDKIDNAVANAGGVKSVNGKAPDASGTVTLEASDIGYGESDVGSSLSQLKDDIENLDKLESVRYIAQSLTDEQKAQARANIDAASLTYVDDENGKIRKHVDGLWWTLPTDPYWADVVRNSIAHKGIQYYGLPVFRLYGSLEGMSKENAVILDFKYGELTGKVKVKWQGSSSLNYEKKNYSMTFIDADGNDRPISVNEAWRERFGEQSKYVAKANWIDATHLRNVACALLWGQVVASRQNIPAKLASSPNYGAIDGFPIMITHNPNPMESATYLETSTLGLYTMTLPKAGFLMGMGNSDTECILSAEKPEDTDYNPGVFFWDNPTIGYDFDVEYPKETPDWVQPSLTALYNAFPADGSWNDELDSLLDWDSVIDYMIFVVLITGTDMIGKNYLLSTYDGTKWFFSAYDMDTTFGLAFNGRWFDNMDAYNTTFNGLWAVHRIFRFALDYKRDRLIARYKELRGGVLSVDNVDNTFRNLGMLISTRVYDLEREIWPDVPSSGVNTIDGIVEQYARKCELADRELGVDDVSSLKNEIGDKLDASALPNAVNDALAQAKESGAFDGADGAPGKDGTDGAPGATGPAGPKGDKGDTGADGYTPQRGVDYWTESDKQQIISDVLSSLSNASGVRF